jgi:hypothetical protein
LFETANPKFFTPPGSREPSLTSRGPDVIWNATADGQFRRARQSLDNSPYDGHDIVFQEQHVGPQQDFAAGLRA